MSYDYQTERPKIFSEKGVEMLLKLRDRAFALIEYSGAARAGNIMEDITGDSWMALAILDYLVERDELSRFGQGARAQDEVFTRRLPR